MKNSIVLIGMPGAGKSTVGVLLAKQMAKSFVDTDILIQERLGESLQSYLDKNGYLALRRIEEEVLLDSEFCHHIISTGGSAVYSGSGMQSLQNIGVIVYLDISLATMQSRVVNKDSRGIACKPGVTLEEVFGERLPLYENYAEITVNCGNLSPEEIVLAIISAYELYG